MKWKKCKLPSAKPVWYAAKDRTDLVVLLRNVYKGESISIESVAEWKQNGKHYVTWHYIPDFEGPVGAFFEGIVKKSNIKWFNKEGV
jgi:hypothetical protein